MDIEQTLAAMDVVLPSAPPPAANYLPWVITGNQLWIAGQAPIRAGKYEFVGRVGAEVTPPQAQAAARLCAINVLAQVKAACAGDWSRLVKGVRICGYISSAPEFFDYPKVLDGCSDFLVEVLGDAGKHVRTVMGVSGLRFNVPIVVDAVFEVRA
ncbi:MAG: endoribonuclease [Betaproteobacteria bacterium]|nr:endoribonuclease [Betaproteobacteria bacterium]